MNEYQEGLLNFIVMVIEMGDERVHANKDVIFKALTVEIDMPIEAIDIQLNMNYN